MFAKVFDNIFDSSIAVNYKTRHVFMDLLTLADSEGVVDMTVEAIARRTNVPLDVVAEAIKDLESPDSQSRSYLEDGRRIVRLDDHRDWGWKIVNYHHYRSMRNAEARREYFRTYQQRRRKQILGLPLDESESTPSGKSVHTCTPSSTEGVPSASASCSEGKGVQRKGKRFPYTADFDQFWKAYPRGDGKIEAWRAWSKAVAVEGFPSLTELLGIISDRSASDEWRRENGKFIPHASTWLNQRRWEDERRNPPSFEAIPSHSLSETEDMDFRAAMDRKRRENAARTKWESTPHSPDEVFTFSE